MNRYIFVFMIMLLLSIEAAWSSGSLFVRPIRSQQTYQAMNIRSYDATIHIRDHVATTHVDQVFVNTLSTIVESTLIFPLPPGAIIVDMAYWFNGKRYVADVRERKAAQATYDSKIRVLVDPALLKEIGENTFQLNIAPIDPRSEVRAETTYVEILPYASNTLSCTHLLRSTSLSPKPLERVSIRANVRSQFDIRSIHVPSVTQTGIHIAKETDREFNVTYGDEQALPTRDLRIDTGTNRSEASMLVATYQPVPAVSFGTNGFFATFVTPPDESLVPLPRSIVVVADVSSSMTDVRMHHLRAAIHAFVDRLHEGDAFNILTFSTAVSSMRPDLMPITDETREEARRFIGSRTALGLTNISDTLKAALSMTYRENTANIVVFLTDGDPSWGITNHTALIDSVKAWNTQDVRIYPIGIGEEPTDALLRGLARAGNGHLTRSDKDDSIAIVVDNNLRRISMPIMRSATLDYGSLEVTELLPQTLPDVPAGDRLLQVGRYALPGRHDVTFTGTVGADSLTLQSTVDFGSAELDHKAVARLWALSKIEQLLDEIARYGERKEFVDAVIALSIRFRIPTKYTALYADPDNTSTSVPNGWPDERPLEVMTLHCAPIPATSEFTVRARVPSSAIGQRGVIELIDLSGRLVATLATIERLESELTLAVRLSSLPVRPDAGAYVVVLRTSVGMATTTILLQ